MNVYEMARVCLLEHSINVLENALSKESWFEYSPVTITKSDAKCILQILKRNKADRERIKKELK